MGCKIIDRAAADPHGFGMSYKIPEMCSRDCASCDNFYISKAEGGST